MSENVIDYMQWTNQAAQTHIFATWPYCPTISLKATAGEGDMDEYIL